GYRYCVEGCPYKKVYYNALKKTSEKCIFCYPRIEGEGPEGEVRGPACAEDCPPQLRMVGFLDDEDGPIHKLVNEYEVAVRLHPEFRTEPNVYYIPPFAPPQHSERGESLDAERIPRTYLEELFGPKVNEALNTISRERDRVRRGEESELMELLNSDRSEKYRLEVFDE
ncbi:MAG: 4Fe-4S dicluster domain-containing protein, partial [Halovenus sp.]